MRDKAYDIFIVIVMLLFNLSMKWFEEGRKRMKEE